MPVSLTLKRARDDEVVFRTGSDVARKSIVNMESFVKKQRTTLLRNSFYKIFNQKNQPGTTICHINIQKRFFHQMVCVI